jgi:hypothetical protein
MIAPGHVRNIRSGEGSIWVEYMKRDIDQDHDLTSNEAYKKKMKEIEDSQQCPCIKCGKQCESVDKFYCLKYKKWRKMMFMSSQGVFK